MPPVRKVYRYAYTLPEATAVAAGGPWVAQVTGLEGTEGTVTHTNVNNFDTTAPSTTLVYTVDELTRAVGETLIYTITIDSNTSGPLDITQVLPANTNNLSNVTFVQNITGGASGSSTSLDLDFNVTG